MIDFHLARVLLIDDDKDLRQIIRRFLTRSGYQTTAVATAEEALVLLGDASFDAIVTDLQMPGMGGNAFVTELRQQFPELVNRLIVTSGSVTVAPPDQIQTQDRICFLQKPYRLSALTAQLATIIAPQLDPTPNAT